MVAGAKLYELRPRGLEGRFFGGISHAAKDSDLSPTSGSGSDHHAKGKKPKSKASLDGGEPGEGGSAAQHSISSASSDGETQAVVGEGMMFKEDNFLTSANLCRWIIDFNEIALGKQVRSHSLTPTHHGTSD
jgi:hypothetical protein